MAKRLVVGLGNPGPEYEKTWHNLGFHVVREVAKRTRSGLKLSGDVLLATGKFAGTDLFLALPQTYMNLSGVPVARLMKQHQLHDDEVLVVFDDHDLPRGQVRIRPSGGDGGHRGLRSILRECGTDAIPRLRIGIRDEEVDPDVGGYKDLADRVLDSITACEEKHLLSISEGSAEIVLDWVRNSTRITMNRHNNRRFQMPVDESGAGKVREIGNDDAHSNTGVSKDKSH